MAVIYSYPNITNPTTSDLLLITDASDASKTKNVTIESVLNLGSGTGTFYTAGDGLDLTLTEFSADLRADSGLKITATEIDIDLDATDITGVFANYNSTTATNSQNVPFNFITEQRNLPLFLMFIFGAFFGMFLAFVLRSMMAYQRKHRRIIKKQKQVIKELKSENTALPDPSSEVSPENSQ